MQMEERNRIVKTYYDPELNPVACVAKCVAGIAIIGLIGVIGVASSENERDKVADNAHVSAAALQAVGAPRQPAIHELRQARIKAKNLAGVTVNQSGGADGYH